MTSPALFLLSVCCHLSVMRVTGGEPVKANIRQEVILPCHLEPPFNLSTLTVEWKRNNTFVHVYRSSKDDPTSQDSQFKGRTSLLPEEMEKGNISLLLRNVSKADEGLYICNVPELHSQVRKGNVTLIVEAAGKDTKQTDGPTDNNNTKTIVIYGVIGGICGSVGTTLWNCMKKKRQTGEQNNQQNDQNPTPLLPQQNPND